MASFSQMFFPRARTLSYVMLLLVSTIYKFDNSLSTTLFRHELFNELLNNRMWYFKYFHPTIERNP